MPPIRITPSNVRKKVRPPNTGFYFCLAEKTYIYMEERLRTKKVRGTYTWDSPVNGN